MSGPILSVNLSAGYAKQTILHDVAFQLRSGERLGLVGSSGAGKSTLLLALLGLLPWRGGWAKGEVLLGGVNLLSVSEREARKLRGKALALVPQSPLTALNSVLSLRMHFAEAWRAHGQSRSELDSRLLPLLARVNLPGSTEFLKRKPTQISVGQAQRVTIALALLHRPEVLIADEPTSSLDPIVQAEVVQLLRELCEEQGTALLFISHDLLSVLQLCQSIALLREGRIAEHVQANRIGEEAKHPMLRALLGTLPAPVDVLLRHCALHAARQQAKQRAFTLPTSLKPYNLGAMVGKTISK